MRLLLLLLLILLFPRRFGFPVFWKRRSPIHDAQLIRITNEIAVGAAFGWAFHLQVFELEAAQLRCNREEPCASGMAVANFTLRAVFDLTNSISV